MTRAISLHGIGKTYCKGIEIVRDLSLDIDPGSTLCCLAWRDAEVDGAAHDRWARGDH